MNKYFLEYKKDHASGFSYFLYMNGEPFQPFETLEDLQAWLITFNGVIDPITENTWGVSAYSESFHKVTRSQYESINAKEDVVLMYGDYRKCKRLLDDNGKEVNTFLVDPDSKEGDNYITRIKKENTAARELLKRREVDPIAL